MFTVIEIKKLIAKVKEDNKASQKIFEDEGYKMKYICYETDVRGGQNDKLQNLYEIGLPFLAYERVLSCHE